MIGRKDWEVKELASSLQEARLVIQRLADEARTADREVKRLTARNSQLEAELAKEVTRR